MSLKTTTGPSSNEQPTEFTGIVVECTRSTLKLITSDGVRTFDVSSFIKGTHEITKTLFQGNIVQKGLVNTEKTIIKKNTFVIGRPYRLEGRLSYETRSFSPENNGCYLCTNITEDYVEMKSIEKGKPSKEIKLTAHVLKCSHPAFRIFGFEDYYK